MDKNREALTAFYKKASTVNTETDLFRMVRQIVKENPHLADL